MTKIVAKLKEQNQDFEWYPTTKEMIHTISQHIVKDFYYKCTKDILDIGAGDGRVLTLLETESLKTNMKGDVTEKYLEINKFVIEKSSLFLNSYDEDINIIGTDFNEQSLLDKSFDIIFSNPPYSVFEKWMIKILSESNCKNIYLIVPERWIKNDLILKTINKVNYSYNIIGNFDFLNAERQARAKVDIIYFNRKNIDEIDPFSIWFENEFNIHEVSENDDYFEKSNETIQKKIVTSENIIEQLVRFYNDDMDKLFKNYKIIEKLDPVILKELNVDVNMLSNNLKSKIIGLKNIYWNFLFEKFHKIRERLTYTTEKHMWYKLTKKTNIDFTFSNIYAVVYWIIKFANKYFNKQLLEVYYDLSDKQNVINYKSNKKLIEDGWRYEKKLMNHYKLDYRLILHKYNLLKIDWNNNIKGISSDAYNTIADIFTIANNLGFNVSFKQINNIKWDWGKKHYFYNKNNELFAEIKVFKNGNMHIKLSQEFMKKFNVEAGKLNNWLKSSNDIKNELNLNENESIALWNNSIFQLPYNNIIKLLNQ